MKTFNLPVSKPSPMSSLRQIPGFPGYFVGDDGSVWSSHRQGIQPKGDDKRPPRLRRKATGGGSCKYPLVNLYAGSRSRRVTLPVHRLVLLAFVGECPEGQETRHLNGDTRDNRLVNLQYGTCVENTTDRMSHGKFRSGETHHKTRLTWEQVREIRRRVGSGETRTALADEFGVSRVCVSNIVSGRTWKYPPEDA